MKQGLIAAAGRMLVANRGYIVIALSEEIGGPSAKVFIELEPQAALGPGRSTILARLISAP